MPDNNQYGKWTPAQKEKAVSAENMGYKGSPLYQALFSGSAQGQNAPVAAASAAPAPSASPSPAPITDPTKAALAQESMRRALPQENSPLDVSLWDALKQAFSGDAPQSAPHSSAQMPPKPAPQR